MPIIVQNTLSNVVSLLDNVMVGQVGTLPMSAVAIINQLLFVYNLVIWGSLAGAGIFGAQFYGRGNMEGVRQTFRIKLVTAAVLTAGAILLFISAGTPLITQYLKGDTSPADAAATLEYARQYLWVMLVGLVPFALTQAYAGTLRESGQTTLPMKASMTAMVVNFILNSLLIFGLFGLPALGVMGAGIATSASRFVECAMVVISAHRSTQRYPFFTGVYRNFHIPASLAREVAIKGAPLLMNEFLWSVSQAALLQCYSVRGIQVVAALNICSTITVIFNEVFLSLGNATSILVGQELGAGHKGRRPPHRLADDLPEREQLPGHGQLCWPCSARLIPQILQHRKPPSAARIQPDSYGCAVHALVRRFQRHVLYSAFRRQDLHHLPV